MAKLGRPKSDNPKNNRVMIRFDQDEYEQLKKCAEDNNLTITEAVRKGVKQMLDTDRRS